MLNIFLILLLSHLIADFYLQSDSFCLEKDKNGFCSWQLYIHALIVLCSAWIMLPDVTFWWGALTIGVSHLTMDGIKPRLKKCKYVFFIDQTFHIAIISLVAFLCQDNAPSLIALWSMDMKYVLYAIGILFICKPANVLIQNIFTVFDLQEKTAIQESSPSLLKAGHIIGIAERIMTFVFVLANQYEAIGFLIAAKSILRFSDKDTARTEYVLVGTLLSFLFAILTAITIMCLM